MSLRIFSKNKTGHYLNVVTMAAFVFSGVQIAVSVEFFRWSFSSYCLAIVAFYGKSMDWFACLTLYPFLFNDC